MHATDLMQRNSDSLQQTQYVRGLGLSSRFVDQIRPLRDLVRYSINQTKPQESFQIHRIPAPSKVHAWHGLLRQAHKQQPDPILLMHMAGLS